MRDDIGKELTCKIANLCISCPVQAGIISFKVANSSFIFDLLLLSIKLCAVFLAIFLPAALVALGCFFFTPLEAAMLPAPDVVVFPVLLLPSLALLETVSFFFFCVCCVFGVIWIIFLALVGGGGRLNSSTTWPRFGTAAVADLFLDGRVDALLCVSATDEDACNSGEAREDMI